MILAWLGGASCSVGGQKIWSWVLGGHQGATVGLSQNGVFASVVLCVWACVWADVGSMRFHAYCFTSLYLLRIRCGVAMGFGCRPHGCLRPIGDRDRFGMGRSARTVFPGFGVVQMQFHKSVEMRSWSPCAVHASLQCILRVVLARSLWIFLNSR